MKEWKWININGLDYMVSNYGDVKGTRLNRLLKTRLDDDGYVCVTLGSDKIGRTRYRVHRLVAKLFVDNEKGLAEVNHIDFNRQNNYYENLEWVSHLDNIMHTVKNNRHVAANGRFKGKNNPNYGNDALKKKYSLNPELAKEKLSRPGSQNGRSRRIRIYDLDYNLLEEFDFIGACAKYLQENEYTSAKINSIRANITKSIKLNKPYLNHYYSFV